MKLYRAETGQQVPWSNRVKIESLDDLKKAIQRCTGVPVDCQILMTSFGTQVKDGQIKEVTTATGADEYIVFIYDRQYLMAPEEQVLQLVDLETPSLEPKVPPFDASVPQEILDRAKEMQKSNLSQTCQLYMSLFSSFDTYSQRLMKAAMAHTQLAQIMVEEQKSQSMALNVAMTNLESHSHIAQQSIYSFCTFGQKELDKQSGLVEAADTNIKILQNIRIHPAVLHAIDKTTVERMMIDYMDVEQIKSAKSKARELCEALEGELHELFSLASDLKRYERDLQKRIAEDQDLQALDASVSDIQDIQKKAMYLRNRIKRDLGRVYTKISEVANIPISSLTSQISDVGEHTSSFNNTSSAIFASASSSPPSSQARKTFEAFDHLTEIHINDYLPKLASYEHDIRLKVAELIWSKRRSIERFLENMTFVSGLQSEIAAVAPRVETANKWIADFKQAEGSRDLEAIQEVLFAYGYLLIEIARRKEYTTVLLDSANAIADLLAGYRSEEQKRRDKFTHSITKMLPFRVSVMEDDTTPQCEISTINIQGDRLEIKRKDIIEFIRILGQHYTAASQSQPNSPRAQSKLGRRTPLPVAGKLGHERTESGRSPSRSQQVQNSISFVAGSDRFIDMLHIMSQQLDGLRGDFFKALETTFFSSAAEPRFQESYISDKSGTARREKALLSFNAAEMELQQKTKALIRAEAQLNSYEARIASLEKALQQSYQVETQSQLQHITPKSEENVAVTNNSSPQTRSTSSSAYSVVGGGEEQTTANLTAEIHRLKETIQQQQTLVDELRSQQSADQEMWEHERDDMRLQVQELEQLLEEERQTYEYNRRSLLKEAQMKDDLADMRVASLEDDWCTKYKELQSMLEMERQKHTAELEELRRSNEEKMAEKDQEMKRLVDNSSAYAKEQAEVRADLDQLRIEYAEYRATTEERLQMLDDSELARDNIKQQLAKARDMVTRAENDWMSKQEALEKALREQDEIHTSLVDILSVHGCMPEETDIWSLVSSIKRCLDTTNAQSKTAKERISVVERERGLLIAKMNRMEEERSEIKGLTSSMADKLEEFRKDIFYEMTNQLQLTVDEEEVKALTKKIMISEHDDDMAIWAQILQAANGVDASKFVGRVRGKVKDSHDLTRKWKRDYKDLREKYHKVSSCSHDKIAFRNFQIGDVALFLPTRNSTGKPWAAFNINAPHYFLKPSESIEQQIHQREWLVARITSLTECTVTSDPLSNPYGLAEGITYYHLEVENWKSAHHRKGHRGQSSRRPGSSKSKGKEPETSQQQQQQPFPMIPKSSPTQDTGLASISAESHNAAGESSASANASGPTLHPRPSFAMSLSTSSVVHSYVPTNSPPSSSRERRHSYFGQDNRYAIDPSLAWTQAHE